MDLLEKWRKGQEERRARLKALFDAEDRKFEKIMQEQHAASVEKQRKEKNLTGWSCGGFYQEPANVNSEYPDFRDFED